MQVPLSLPATIYGWLALFASITTVVLFIRYNDIRSIRDANDELRKRLDDKDAIIKDLQAQLDVFRQELGKLRGILEEKDKRIDTLQSIRVAASPEMVTYMGDMRTFTSQAHEYIVASTKTLTEINSKLK